MWFILRLLIQSKKRTITAHRNFDTLVDPSLPPVLLSLTFLLDGNLGLVTVMYS